MKLDDAQRKKVATWIDEGAKLSEIQNRLASEFGLKFTYMEARFLVDDLKLTPRDPEPPKTPEPPAAKPATATPLSTTPVAPGENNPARRRKSFRDRGPDCAAGHGGERQGDLQRRPDRGMVSRPKSGRLGVVPKQQGYKPSAADVQDFQLALQQEVAKLGY